MSRIEIIEKLKNIFEMVIGKEGETSKFSEESRLVEDIGLNSVGMLYIVIGIEEFFSFRFTDVGFANFKTVKDVVDYIEKKVN